MKVIRATHNKESEYYLTALDDVHPFIRELREKYDYAVQITVITLNDKNGLFEIDSETFSRLHTGASNIAVYN